jgi:hypothetical protein
MGELQVLVALLQRKYGSWGEHPTFTRSDWRDDVAAHDTQLGYWEWVQHNVESRAGESVMDESTLVALNGSINKWAQIFAGKLTDKGTTNCPLCEKFYERRDPDNSHIWCYGCPVSKRVNDDWCDSTPYIEWQKHQRDQHNHTINMTVDCPTCTELAQAELEFLRSLLPDEEEPMI